MAAINELTEDKPPSVLNLIVYSQGFKFTYSGTDGKYKSIANGDQLTVLLEGVEVARFCGTWVRLYEKETVQ